MCVFWCVSCIRMGECTDCKWLWVKDMYCNVMSCVQEKQRFLTDVLHEVMQLDGLNSSHPISQEVEEAADIDRVFDWIAYKKVSPLRLFVPSKV